MGGRPKKARPDVATVESPAVEPPAAAAPDGAHAPAADAPSTPRERTQAVVLNVGEFYPMSENDRRSESFRAARKKQKQDETLAAMGGSYVDDAVVAKGTCSLVNDPCPGCDKRAPVRIGGSTHRGFGGGSFDYICLECNEERHVLRSEKLASTGAGPKIDVNTVRAVNAYEAAGLGYEKYVVVCQGLNMRFMSQGTWSHNQKLGASAAEAVKREMFAENLQKEIDATLLHEGDAARDPVTGKVFIRVMEDGSWQKRYGHNSLWGYGAIYGYYTGRALFVDHRCAYCATCASSAFRGVEKPTHQCTKNWDMKSSAQGAAGNMEKHIALAGVIALFDAGAIVRTFCCDGDTKTVDWIRVYGPKEVAAVITVVLDGNHVSKSVGGKLRDLKQLKKKEATVLQRAYMWAVYEARDEAAERGLSDADAAGLIQAKVRGVPPHMFDVSHAGCGASCPKKVGNACFDAAHVPKGLKSFIARGAADATYSAVAAVFETYSSDEFCKKLVMKASTNTCESGNSLLWLEHLPKTHLQSTSAPRKLWDSQIRKQQGRLAAAASVRAKAGLRDSTAVIEQGKKRDRAIFRCVSLLPEHSIIPWCAAVCCVHMSAKHY